MKIYCNGTAIIEYIDTDRRYRIEAKELDWQSVSGDEGNMGTKFAYEAVVEHPELGLLTWSLYEYPMGALEGSTTDTGRHKLIKDLDYGLEDEEGYRCFLEYPLSKSAENYVKNLPNSEKKKFIQNWFSYFFEPPEEKTPYEGEFIWIYGGPYDAEEELNNNFEDSIVSQKIIDDILSKLEQESYLWGPSDNHRDMAVFLGGPDENNQDTFASYEKTLFDIQEKIENGVTPKIGNKEEQEKREELKKLITKFQELIQDAEKRTHNNPPEHIEHEYINIKNLKEKIDNLANSINDINKENFKNNASIKIIIENTAKLYSQLNQISKKRDIAMEQIIKRTIDSSYAFGTAAVIYLWLNAGNILAHIAEWFKIIF